MIILKPKAKPNEIKFSIPYVETKTIKPISKNIIIHAQGTVSPYTESQIFSEIIGPITYISPNLQEGASFEKGDVLATIDSKDYELDIISAESILTAATTKLSIEQAESNLALKEWNKIGLGEPNDLTLRIPQLEQAKSEFKAAKANLERLKRNLDKTIIKAP